MREGTTAVGNTYKHIYLWKLEDDGGSDKPLTMETRIKRRRRKIVHPYGPITSSVPLRSHSAVTS